MASSVLGSVGSDQDGGRCGGHRLQGASPRCRDQAHACAWSTESTCFPRGLGRPIRCPCGDESK